MTEIQIKLAQVEKGILWLMKLKSKGEAGFTDGCRGLNDISKTVPYSRTCLLHPFLGISPVGEVRCSCRAAAKRFGPNLKIFSSPDHHKSKFSPMSDIAGPQAPSGPLLPDLFQLLMLPSCLGLSFCPLGNHRGASRPVSQMLHQNARMVPNPGPSWTTCSPLIQSGCAVLIGLGGQSLQLEKEWMGRVHLGKSSPWNKTELQTSGLGCENTGCSIIRLGQGPRLEPHKARSVSGLGSSLRVKESQPWGAEPCRGIGG